MCVLGGQLWSLCSNLSSSGCPDLHTGLEKNQGEFRIGGVLQDPILARSECQGREGKGGDKAFSEDLMLQLFLAKANQEYIWTLESGKEFSG